MKSVKSYYRFILGIACAILIGACGGGGGGSSEITYTGSTTPASITTTNGGEIATSAYTNGAGGTRAGSIFGSSITEPQGGAHNGTPRTTTLIQALLGSIDKIDLTAISQHSLSRATQSYNQTVAGLCGGTKTDSGTIDDVTFDFNGTTTFNNFCEDNTTVNGSTNVSGSFFGQLTMTFSSLTITDSNGSFTSNGNVIIDLSATPLAATINITTKDNTTNKISKVENFIVAITINPGIYVEFSMSGKIYHPDYGYVDVTTPTPFRIYDGLEWPSSGEMISTGANSSKVRLLVIDNTAYNYYIDADGDGLYETEQLNQLWSNL